MIKRIIEFLKSRVFIKNLILALIIIVLFFVSVSYFLSSYTRHGQFIILPNLVKIKLTDAQKLLKDQELECVIIDSAYDENSKPGMVLSQNPYPGAHVKKGRNVYLKITSSAPPLVPMPDLHDKSLRQALLVIDNSGLKKGRVIEVENPLPGFVITQKYKGSEIAPGIKIPKGSVIDIEVGKGSIPDSLR